MIMETKLYKDLSDEYKVLLDSAETVLQNSYSPYSRFSVGAALLSSEGDLVAGTNYENASYGLCTCAERVALTAANSQGIKSFKAIAIIAKHKDHDCKELTSPCGSCRQLIFEAGTNSKHDLEVIMSNSDKSKITIAKISELLPLSFGPASL